MSDAYLRVERDRAWAGLPAEGSHVDSLVAYVDHCVALDGCDHTLRFSRQWADERGVGWHGLRAGVEAAGAYCDCEVVMNLGPDARA